MFRPLTDKKSAAEFLREAALYFSNRPTGGEDRAFWSNVRNAHYCNEIADRIEGLMDELH